MCCYQDYINWDRDWITTLLCYVMLRYVRYVNRTLNKRRRSCAFLSMKVTENGNDHISLGNHLADMCQRVDWHMLHAPAVTRRQACTTSYQHSGNDLCIVNGVCCTRQRWLVDRPVRQAINIAVTTCA